MKSRTKYLALICVMAMLAALVSGCGSAPAESAASSAAASETISAPELETEGPASAAEPEPEPEAEEPAPAELEAEPQEPEEPQQELTPEQEQLLTIIPEGDLLTFVELPLSENHETLSIYLGIHSMLLNMFDDLSDMPLYKALEEETGVHLEFTAVNAMGDDGTVLNLMIAADDLTDIGSFGSGLTQGIDNAIDDGTIIDLQDHFDVMPNYSALIENSDRFRRAVTTTGGHIPGASQYTMHNAAIYRTGLLIRQDWLEDLGLAVPETIGELYDALTAFKNEKGAAAAYDMDTAGGIFTGVSGFGGTSTFLTRAYGTDGGDFRMDENGNVESGWLMEGFKDYLTEMNKWYSEGLMAPDFYTAVRMMSDWSNVANDVNGVIASFASEIEEIKYYSSDPDFALVAMPDPVLNKGDKLELEKWFLEASPGGGYEVAGSCENQELACKWLDYLYSPNGWLLCNYGIEGESFEYGKDGMPHWTEVITNPGEIPSGVAKSMYMIVQGPCLMYSPREFDAYTDAMIDASDIWASNIADKTYEYPNTITLVGADAEEYASLISDISTYISETAIRFITGELDLEGDFETFKDTLKNLNIDRVLEIKQAAYDEYEASRE